MNFSNPFRDELARYGPLNDLIDLLTANISASLSQQHNDDGTHGDVTFTLGSATAYDVGAGVWMAPTLERGIVTVDSAYDLRVGDPSGNYFAWDGSAKTLTVNGSGTFTGSITATSGTIGGWTIGSDYLRDTGAVVGLSSAVTGGDDIRIWAGHATPGSAPFRVTEAGVLTASSGTVGGWTLGSSSLTGGDATLASSGNLTLGTSNDVIRISADDATYRAWIGHATAGSAPFRVTKAGAVTASSGTVGGWTLAASTLTGGDATLAASGNLTLGTSNDVARVSADDATYRLWIGHATAGSAPFRVTKAGALTASNATITGSITSTSGTIGGWTIGSSSLTGGDATLASSGNLTLGTSNDVVRLSADDATYRAWIGHATAGSAPFRVTKAGAVTASSGTVGGWTIGSSTLTGGDATLAASGNLTLGTSNDVVRLSADDATYRAWIGHATAGSAPFRVTKAGAVTATNATITGASGTVAIDSTGILVTPSSNGFVASGSYRFGTSWGVYGDISDGGPTYSTQVITTKASALVVTSLKAVDGSYSAEVSIEASSLYTDGLIYLKTNGSTRATVSSAGIAWGGGSAIASSGNAALLDAANTFSNTGTHTFSGAVAVSRSTNAGVKATVTNATSGTAGHVAFEGAAGTVTGGTYVFSQGYTTSGVFQQSSSLLYNDSAGGIVLAATNGSGPIKLFAGGTTEWVRLTTDGGLGLADGITAPATATGFAVLYVDTADGDLKVKFGDGTIKTIVTDT